MKAKHPYKSTTHEEYFVHQKVGPTKREIEDSKYQSADDPEKEVLGRMMVYPDKWLQPCMLGKHAITHVTYFIRKEDDGHYYYTQTYCSLVDQFDKEEGRKHARSKYFRTPQYRQGLPGSYRDFMKALFPEQKPTDGPLLHDGVEFPRSVLP